MNHQRGATLIVVLIILLLVTIVGTIAIRSSLLGLRISTNNQINNLLVGNSDAAIFNIETPNAERLAYNFTAAGVYHYLTQPDNKTDELVFCYKANNANFFEYAQASAVEANGGTTKLGVNGFCKADSFSTGRSAILSQVYLRLANGIDNGVEPFSGKSTGTSIGIASQSEKAIVDIGLIATVVSVLPNFSSATNSQVEECFKKSARITSGSSLSAVETCFKDLNIPYNVQTSEFNVSNSPKAVP